MKEYTKSDITNKVYCPEDCVRLVNMRQVAIYALNGEYMKKHINFL